MSPIKVFQRQELFMYFMENQNGFNAAGFFDEYRFFFSSIEIRLEISTPAQKC